MANQRKQNRLQLVLNFFSKDLWQIQLNVLSQRKALYIKTVRVLTFSISDFKKDNCVLHASALTFFTLISIVPVLAMIFAIAKGFGLESLLENMIRENLSSQSEMLGKALEFSHSLLQNTHGGLIAGVGVGLLLWSVVKLMSNIESALNTIWKLAKDRTWLKKFNDYLAIILLAPVLMIISSSMAVVIETNVVEITKQIRILGYAESVILFFLNFIPYVIQWLLFTFLYVSMPNTKVPLKPAFIAGIVSGTAFQLTQWAYIHFQVGVAQYNAIYGSFAALPLFLGWVNISWTIVLFGAEIAYSIQNLDHLTAIKREEEHANNQSQQRFYAIRIMQVIIDNFTKGLKPLSLTAITEQTELSAYQTDILLEKLAKNNIVSITKDNKDRAHYQPGIDPSLITMGLIIKAFDYPDTENTTISFSRQESSLAKTFITAQQKMYADADAVLIRDFK